MPAENSRPEPQPEPWMRATHSELHPVLRAVVHALELAEEDVERWCGPLSTEQMFARPEGVAPLAFHLRHIARSLDRLLTYAEGRALDAEQLAALATEMHSASADEVMTEFREGLRSARKRVRAFSPGTFAEARVIGRRQLPTTVAGLLIHCAEHTSRHVGQAVTTAQLCGSKKAFQAPESEA